MKMAVVPEERLNTLIKRYGSDSDVGHVVLAYDTLFTACCDPNSKTLEWKPIDMILPCPACGTLHVDAPEPVCGSKVFENSCLLKKHHTGPCSTSPAAKWVAWDNPPHKSHLCHNCGAIWRPADVPTNGVAEIKTQGKDDTWRPEVKQL